MNTKQPPSARGAEPAAGGAHCRWPGAAGDASSLPDPDQDLPADGQRAEAVLAGGCFWCLDAVFRRVEGVLDSVCGYAGGSAETASYRRVCAGDSGHAEVVQVVYDPQRISYGALLKLFFGVAHDPTQYQRQGNDIGPQYRSAIFYADAAQQAVAAAYIRQLDAAGVFPRRIVTTLEPLQAFYPAEPEHQDYARRHADAGYVRLVAQPKVDRLQRLFSGHLRARE